MKFKVSQTTELRGSVSIPTSKSHTLRAIFFSLLADGKSVIRSPLGSTDAQSMIQAIEQYGAKVEQFDDRIEVIGVGKNLHTPDDVISSGNSGIVLRFVGAVAALLPTYSVLTGDQSIRHNRPAGPLLDGLQQLGVFAKSMRQDELAPIIIRGPIKPDSTITMDGKDSQPVSAILNIAGFAPKGTKTTVNVKDPGETPWLDLTCHWLNYLNVSYTKTEGYGQFVVDGGVELKGFDYTVPGDCSSMAFPLVAAMITDSEITLENIDMNDIQGDKKIVDALIEMGAKIDIDSDRRLLKVRKGSRLTGKSLDINDYVDAITIMAVVGVYAEGTTVIRNAAIARRKESDRIHVIAEELKKMGASIEETPDGLIIQKSQLTPADNLFAHHDHRVAMSLAVASLGVAIKDGTSIIDDTSCTRKTYPSFASQMKKLGMNIEEIEDE